MQAVKMYLAAISLSLLGLGGLFLSFYPTLPALTLIPSMTICLVIGMLFAGRRIWARPSKIMVLALVMGGAAVPFAVIVRAFGNFDVLAFVFHAQFGIEGASLKGFEADIAVAIIAVSAVIFAAWTVGSLIRRPRTIASLAAISLILANPALRAGQGYALQSDIISDLHLMLRKPEKIALTTLPDIVIIYLEGIERFYADRDFFGDIYAPVEAYAERGISFSKIRQVRATGWSLSGLVATQCGLPLVPNGFRHRNEFTMQVDFLAGHECLGGFTDGIGYQNAFVVGGLDTFGGINHFLRTHRINDVIDYNVIQEMFAPDVFAAGRAGQMVDDELVFEAAKKVHTRLAAEDAPMVLMVETYGPHGTSSLLSRGCTASGRAEATKDAALAVPCTLNSMVNFLDYLEAARGDRPTIVVLLSDHLNHDPGLHALIDLKDRANTFIIYSMGFASPIKPEQPVNDRLASMMDVYPTLLAYAGLTDADAGAGLGRSLFGKGLTLMEEKGHALLNDELFPNPLLNAAIWRPSLD